MQLLRDDKFSVRLRAGHILRQLDDTDRLLARITHPPSRHILREFVATSRLRRPAFPRLIRCLTTAHRRPRPNFTLAAVFALYTHGLHRPAIARALDLAEPTVRNAVTTFYRIFDMPALHFTRRADRRHRLVELARREGFIAVDRSHQVVGGIALHIQVDHQGAIAHGRPDGGEVTGDAGLADPALLIEYDAFHSRSPPG